MPDLAFPAAVVLKRIFYLSKPKNILKYLCKKAAICL